MHLVFDSNAAFGPLASLCKNVRFRIKINRGRIHDDFGNGLSNDQELTAARSSKQPRLCRGVAQIASPFVIPAWAADEVKIGLDNPLTGTYAAVGKNELIGCQLAVEQINAKGGILGRKVELQWSRKIRDQQGDTPQYGGAESATS